MSLDQLPEPLPPLGAPVSPAGPLQLESLGSQEPSLQREIQTLAGEMAAWPLPTGGHRLFVPTRAEGSLLQVIDATGPAGTSLACVPDDTGGGQVDCTLDALRLADVPAGSEEEDFPRAPAPFGVATSPAGQVFVTHNVDADSPRGSFTQERGYVVRLDAANPALGVQNFVEVPIGGTQSVAIGQRYAFVTARSLSRPTSALDLVTAVPRDPADTVVRSFPLQSQFATSSGRGIALTSDETRLYVVGRSPDVLLVVDVRGAQSAFPALEVVRAVPLPATPGPIKLIERPGKGALVIVASQSTGSLSIYDDGLGQLATEVLGLGLQPFAVAVDLRETAGAGGATVRQARIFVSNFGDGRIAVVDVPDLDQPEEARVVAHLGARQNDVQGTQSVTCRVGE